MLLLPMAGIAPIVMTGAQATQNRPPNVSGVWVTLMGRGGVGGNGGVTNDVGQTTSGGSGGGGGAYIPRVWIPVQYLGPTFSVSMGSSTSSSTRVVKFTSGSIVLSAGWGNNGGFYNAGGQGGVASATGFTDGVVLLNGGEGGNGGLGGASKGQVGASTTNGAGAGGGGGGGSGSGKGGIGGTAVEPGTGGATGTNGSYAGGGQRGGNGGAGGGWTAASGQNTPGAGYAELEWN